MAAYTKSSARAKSPARAKTATKSKSTITAKKLLSATTAGFKEMNKNIKSMQALLKQLEMDYKKAQGYGCKGNAGKSGSKTRQTAEA